MEIVVYYQKTTPESVEQGDYSETGEEEIKSVDNVEEAVNFIRDYGANEPSDSNFRNNVWYSSYPSSPDQYTGEETSYTLHLRGFSEAEQHEIFNRINRLNSLQAKYRKIIFKKSSKKIKIIKAQELENDTLKYETKPEDNLHKDPLIIEYGMSHSGDFVIHDIINKTTGENIYYDASRPEENKILDVLNRKTKINNCWVNVYEVSRNWGGAEEGGWYYTWRELKESHEVKNIQAAKLIKKQLEEKYRDWYVDEEFEVAIERFKGESQSTERPHYE